MYKEDAFMLILVLAIVVLFILAVWASISMPSCEEQGGKEVFSHMQMIPISTGKITTIQSMPIYKCVMPEEEK